MKLRITFAFLVLRLLLLVPCARSQSAILDQTHTYFTAYSQANANYTIAQTFVPAVAGQLEHVAVRTLLRNPFDVYPFVLSVRETADGAPVGRLLGRVVFSNYLAMVGWHDVLFSTTRVHLRTNVMYALVFACDSPSSGVDFSTSWTGDHYANGTQWNKFMTNDWEAVVGSDVLFQTYMIPGLPEIWLTAPLENARYQAGETAQLVAEVGAGGSAGRVDFHADGILLGSVSSEPYEFSWNSPSPGNHTVTAVLDDGSGMVSTSAPVHIIVSGDTPANDDFARRFTLTGGYVSGNSSNINATTEPGEPSHGSNALGASVWWSWTASNSGPVSVSTIHSAHSNLVVDVYYGSSVDALNLQASGKRETIFVAQGGRSYEIAVDSVGAACENIVLDVAEADLRLTSPANDSAFTAPSAVRVAATGNFGARSIQRVEFYENGVLLGAATNSPYELIYVAAIPGTYTLIAKAVDTRDIVTSSSPVVIRVRPQNDAFANAIRLDGYTAAVNASTLNATMQPGEFRWADNRGGHSIWYWWTAPETGTCTLSGTGPGSGLLFSVYVGSTLSSGTNTPIPGPGSLTIVTANAFEDYGVPTSFHAIAGTTYRISVDGFQGEEGEVSFALQLNPVNDRFADATLIFGEHFASFASNRGASREVDEPPLAAPATGRSVWWNWTAPASGPVRLTCTSTNMQPVLAVYSGATLSNLTLISVTNDGTNGRAVVDFNATVGTTYFIVVDGSSTEGTTFDLELTMALLRITAPLPGQVFAHPASVRLSAQVPPLMSGVNVLEFYDNDQLIGAVTNAPFSLLWENVPPGSHPLTVRGVDASGNTNVSLPVGILVYTNNSMPTPKLATWRSTSYAIDAMGNLYVWGLNGPGFYGLSGTFPDSGCIDPFDPECEVVPEKIWYPQIAKFPPGVTGWQAVSGSYWMTIAGMPVYLIGGWALANDGQIYRYGLFPTNPAPGAMSWKFLQNTFMIDDQGRLYQDGVLWNPQGPYPWQEVMGGFLVTTGRQFYTYAENNFHLFSFPEGVTTWKAVSCGSHCLALGDDGELYAWGDNYSGQLGLGDTGPDRYSPTRVPPPPGVTNWTAIAAGAYHSLAITGDGQLYAWGRNWENQLGVGYTPNQTTNRPAKVPLPVGVTKWTAVAGGHAHSLAIGDDCQLYAWGDNSDGQIGTGPGPSVPLPTRVPGLGPLCGIPVIVPGNSIRLPNGDFLVEFPSALNCSYNIQYSSDMQNWITVFPAITGTGQLIQWTDDGPPKTHSAPRNESARFYRVVRSQ